MSDRNYAVEMRAFIDAATGDESYVPAIVAAEVADKLRANDPELLAGWLDAQAEDFIRICINKRDHSRRSVIRHRARAGAFGAAAEAHQAGDDAPLRQFLDAPFSVETGERKRLGDLTRDDLLFVESDYRSRANENLMRASFFSALAKKVKAGTVADHFTEDQIASMYDSLDLAA